MKTLFYSISISILLLLSLESNAQITLEHTFDDLLQWQGDIYMEQNLYPTNTYQITGIKDNSYSIMIYNSDYSLQSSKTFNFTPPIGYKISTVSVSRKLFNSDENYEFMVSYVNDNAFDNTHYKIKLYDQNGNVIKDFGTSYILTAYSYLHVVNGKLRLIIYNLTVDGKQKTEIYSVPGVAPAKVNSINESIVLPPYPNPSNSVITIPYQLQQGEKATMNIYNVQGQLIEIKNIDSNFNKALLNVSAYNKGTYIYELNGISKKFIVD